MDAAFTWKKRRQAYTARSKTQVVVMCLFAYALDFYELQDGLTQLHFSKSDESNYKNTLSRTCEIQKRRSKMLLFVLAVLFVATEASITAKDIQSAQLECKKQCSHLALHERRKCNLECWRNKLKKQPAAFATVPRTKAKTARSAAPAAAALSTMLLMAVLLCFY